MDRLIHKLDLPGYRIEEKIGEGSSGVVYRAQQLRLERPVAMKVLYPSSTENPEYVERFRREIQTVGDLNHPCIVQVYDVGEQDGLHYYVMEYVEGKTLTALIEEQGRIAPDRAVEIGIDIAHALAYIHENGLMHRDIKPDNIMINDKGRAKLCDLGIARKVRGSEQDAAEEDLLLGKPYYISPEQALGEELDIRSDIYSLGATLYHAVTGRVPFRGDDVQTIIKQHVKGDPVSPQKINQKLSPQFNELITGMMAPDPIERPQTPEQLVEQLETIQEIQEQSSKRRTVRSGSRSRRKQSSSRFTLIILLVVGMLMAGGLFFLLSDQTGDRSGREVSQKLEKEKEKGEEEKSKSGKPSKTSNEKHDNGSGQDTVPATSGDDGTTDEEENTYESGETGEKDSRSDTSDNETTPDEEEGRTTETTDRDPQKEAVEESEPSGDASTGEENRFALRNNPNGGGIASADPSDGGGAFGRRGRRAYPKFLNRYERDRGFEFTDELEIGQVSVWRIGPDQLLIQGGLRNGLDRAVKDLRVTLTVKTPDKKTVDEPIRLDRTVLPGEIVPFSKTIAGISDYDSLSYSFDYVPDPSATGRKSMKWSDVKDQLIDPEEKFDTRSGSLKTVESSQAAPESPLVSLHGMERIYSTRQGKKTEVALLKLRIKQDPSTEQVPAGQLAYQVLEDRTVQLDQRISIEPTRIQPAPETFDPGSVEAGNLYRDEKNNMIYVALYEAEGEHPSVRLNLRLTLDDRGTWTFLQVKPPFRHEPVPPDQVLSGKTNPSGGSGEDGTGTPPADGSSNTASKREPSSTDEQERQSPSPRTPDWADPNWKRRVPVTVNSERVPTDLRNFPVYVDLSQMPDAFFNHVNSPEELRVTAGDGQTPVPREVVSLSVLKQKGELHFLAKKLRGQTNTTFYLYYGNSEKPGPPATPFQSNQVWTEQYHSVQHLNGTGDAIDNRVWESEGNPNTGADGKLGEATRFDGAGDILFMDRPRNGFEAGESFTVSWWHNTTDDEYSTPDGPGIVTKGFNQDKHKETWLLSRVEKGQTEFLWDDGHRTLLTGPGSYDGSWHQVIAVYEAGN